MSFLDTGAKPFKNRADYRGSGGKIQPGLGPKKRTNSDFFGMLTGKIEGGPMIRKPLLMLCCCALLGAPQATAKIVKMARPDCKTSKICFYWWPELPALRGWHTDSAVNYSLGANGANVLIPDGSDFANAPTIIYATATYKPNYRRSNPNIKTLDDFIADDKSAFRSENQGDITISDAAPLRTGDGDTLRSVTYFRPKAKHWDRVAFGEDDEYYYTFTVNARSLAKYNAAQQVFESLLKMYKR